MIKPIKQRYRSNYYTDNDIKMNLSICMCVLTIIALSDTGTDKVQRHHKAYHKVNEAKLFIRSICGR